MEVAASVRDGFLLLAVADHGPGVPPAVLPRIFDKFYRAPDAATGGTGLGFSLVKGFIEAQGGSVTAENGAVRRHGFHHPPAVAQRGWRRTPASATVQSIA